VSRCTKTPGCLMNAGHAGACGTLRDLVVEGSAYVRRKADRAANWAAAKVLRALGHEVPR
jgi:hypothetical protein